MRQLLVIASIVLCSGCLARDIINSPQVSGPEVQPPYALAPGEEFDPYEEERIAGLIDKSRTRLYEDPVAGPKCASNVSRTGRRTWSVSSCEGQVKCWALDPGFDCERVASAARPAL